MRGGLFVQPTPIARERSFFRHRRLRLYRTPARATVAPLPRRDATSRGVGAPVGFLQGAIPDAVFEGDGGRPTADRGGDAYRRFGTDAFPSRSEIPEDEASGDGRLGV